MVALGGGTGLPALLEAIKPRIGDASRFEEVSAIVTVSDDGGSSGRLRRDLGTPPPGDLRNCLIALSDAPEIMRDLFQYRFTAGELEGHSLGNILIAALADFTGDFSAAVTQLHDILAIRGRIYPSTFENITLSAQLDDGEVILGEAAIPLAGKPIGRLSLVPPDCRAVPEACEELERADLILLGPGSLYTSVLPHLLVRDLAEAIRASRARKVYVCNLVTQPGETEGFTACRHLEVIWDHCGPGLVDTVLCNDRPLPAAMLEAYRSEGSTPVEMDPARLAGLGLSLVRADLLAEGDRARHDPQKLRNALADLARTAMEVA